MLCCTSQTAQQLVEQGKVDYGSCWLPLCSSCDYVVPGVVLHPQTAQQWEEQGYIDPESMAELPEDEETVSKVGCP
jgi:hypothetical protein